MIVKSQLLKVLYRSRGFIEHKAIYLVREGRCLYVQGQDLLLNAQFRQALRVDLNAQFRQALRVDLNAQFCQALRVDLNAQFCQALRVDLNESQDC